jgi:hypothetical protein
LGRSARNFTIPHPGNFCETVYTEQPLLDAKMQIERLVESASASSRSKTIFLNSSNGISISGFLPVDSDAYFEKYGATFVDVQSALSALSSWRLGLLSYPAEVFYSSWKSARPREGIFVFTNNCIDILSQEPIDFEHLIPRLCTELVNDSKIRRKDLLPIRVVRGFLIKAVTAARRQIIVMRSAQLPEDIICKFAENQTLLISSSLRLIEQEMYQLCDYIDKEYSSALFSLDS